MPFLIFIAKSEEALFIFQIAISRKLQTISFAENKQRDRSDTVY